MTVTQLTTTQLGRTGLQITPVGFGAWAIGGGNWEFGWGQQDDDESIAAIHHALAQGINWIDTAAAYGFGRSELIVGRALEGLRERPYVLTKCSLLEGPDRTVTHRLKRDSILREAEASLTRLGVDAIDVYQIHWPIASAAPTRSPRSSPPPPSTSPTTTSPKSKGAHDDPAHATHADPRRTARRRPDGFRHGPTTA